MITIDRKIRAFCKLGHWLRSAKVNTLKNEDSYKSGLDSLMAESQRQNPWFRDEFIRYALNSLGESLQEDKLNKWLREYSSSIEKERVSRRVAVINAGNIPMVGFHDFLCVISAGHSYIGKLASDDKVLLPAMAAKLIEFEPEFARYCNFEEGRLTRFDAVIATGSNNTARYFEYYFGRYPHIIRKNRNGVAVLTGNESAEELNALADDVFLYFGMGCRSIAKLFIPTGFSFDAMFMAFEKYRTVSSFHKYMNNYDYYKSIFLINQTGHLDTGFLLVKEDLGFSSPPAVLFTETYESVQLLNKRLDAGKEDIQCIVSHLKEIDGTIPFGKTQKPELWDYADGVDTMAFLTRLT